MNSAHFIAGAVRKQLTVNNAAFFILCLIFVERGAVNGFRSRKEVRSQRQTLEQDKGPLSLT